MTYKSRGGVELGATMGKLGGVRLFEVPEFKAVCSGLDTQEKVFGQFQEFLRALKESRPNAIKTVPPYDAPDLAMFEGDKVNWFWAVEDWVGEADVAPYELTEFEGGTYAVAVADENDLSDCTVVYDQIVKWVGDKKVNCELDIRPGHGVMCHRIGCGAVQEALGMAQQELFVPVKIRTR